MAGEASVEMIASGIEYEQSTVLCGNKAFEKATADRQPPGPREGGARP